LIFSLLLAVGGIIIGIAVIEAITADPDSLYYGIALGALAGVGANLTSYFVYSLYALLGFGLLAIYYARTTHRFYNHNACILVSLYLASGYLAYYIPIIPPLADFHVEYWVRITGFAATVLFLVLSPLGKLRSIIGLILSLLSLFGIRQFTPGSILAVGFFPAVLLNMSLRTLGVGSGFWLEITAATAVIGAVSVMLLLNNYDLVAKPHQGLVVNPEEKKDATESWTDHPNRLLYREPTDGRLYWEPATIPSSIAGSEISKLAEWGAQEVIHDLSHEGYPSPSITMSWSEGKNNENHVVTCRDFCSLVVGIQPITNKDELSAVELVNMLDKIVEEYEEHYPTAEIALFVTNQALSDEAIDKITERGFLLIESIKQETQTG